MTSPTKSLRVAMLIDTWFPHKDRKVGIYGGDQVHVRELKKYLELKHNCRVTLFYQAHPHLLVRSLWPLIAVTDLLLYNRYQPLDLIHAHGTLSGVVGKVAAHLLKIPLVHTVHNSSLMDLDRRTPQAILEKYTLTRLKYDAQITVSQNFLRYPNVNLHPVVIPNGVNLSEFNAIKVNKNPVPTLIWVGQNHPAKGLNYLKKAILKIRKVYPNLQADLVEGGRLTGKDLIKAYKHAHVFVLASLVESQPISLLEAWAARLPVVVTEVGDNATMVKPGINGYLVEPGNATQLAMTIIKVLRARKSALKMGEAGYTFVKDNFSWQKVARETYAVYRQVRQSPVLDHQINEDSVPDLVNEVRV